MSADETDDDGEPEDDPLAPEGADEDPLAPDEDPGDEYTF